MSITDKYKLDHEERELLRELEDKQAESGAGVDDIIASAYLAGRNSKRNARIELAFIELVADLMEDLIVAARFIQGLELPFSFRFRDHIRAINAIERDHERGEEQ